MWDVLQNVARNISLMLDGHGGSPRKCPRCRGSGFLKTACANWEKNEGRAHQPCWFCEGIGILPIAGLNGFVLARATPCLGTFEKHSQSYKETSHQHASDDKKGAVKFTNKKLNVVSGDLLCDCKTLWINELMSSLSSQWATQQEYFESSKVKGSIPTLQPHSSLGILQPLSRSQIYKINSDNVLQGPLAISVSPPEVASCVPSPITSAALTLPVNNSAGKSHLGDKSIVVFGRHMSFLQRASESMPALMVEIPGAVALRPTFKTKSCMLSPRRRRPLRRARNSIRDKARREAMERARGLIRSLKFHEGEDLDSADHYHQYGCFDKSSADLECREATLEGLSPLGTVPRMASLTGIVEFGQIALHHPFTRTFKGFMPPLRNNSNRPTTLPVLSSLSWTIRAFLSENTKKAQ